MTAHGTRGDDVGRPGGGWPAFTAAGLSWGLSAQAAVKEDGSDTKAQGNPRGSQAVITY